MLPEIGLVVSLYVLARLLASARPQLWKGVSALAIVVTSVVVLDLAVRIFLPDGIRALLFRSESTAERDASKPPTRSSTGSVTRTGGGSITTVLAYGFAVAKGSSLQREWIAVHDSTMPVVFEGTPGVTTTYLSREYGGEYRYRASFTVVSRETVRAIEVRFLTFDVWGEHVRTLNFEEVADVAAKSKKEMTGE